MVSRYDPGVWKHSEHGLRALFIFAFGRSRTDNYIDALRMELSEIFKHV
jgi:hypothetical protein